MTVRKRYYRLGKYAVTPASGHCGQKSLRDILSRSWESVPTLGHAAGRGQERLSGETADYEKAEERMSKKLPEIERTPGGGLPRLKPGQRKRANALIRKTCCNYENGNCLLLDDGEECVCPQTLSYSVCCKWFRWAVLPQDKALEAEIFRSARVKRCAECGATFVPRSNRAKYCEACARRVHRRQKNASDRKRRWRTDK